MSNLIVVKLEFSLDDLLLLLQWFFIIPYSTESVHPKMDMFVLALKVMYALTWKLWMPLSVLNITRRLGFIHKLDILLFVNLNHMLLGS